MFGMATTLDVQSVNGQDEFVLKFSQVIAGDQADNVRVLKLLGRIGRSDIVWDRVAAAYNLPRDPRDVRDLLDA